MPNDLLTPELTERIASLIESGNFPDIAAKACGISPATYRNWIKRGEGRDRNNPSSPEYVTFSNRMREAEALAESQYVKLVKDGSVKDPSLALKFLSRRFKDRWSETVKHEVSWVVKAIHMLRTGEVTLEALQGELPADDYELVKVKYLENPTVDGEYVEIDAKVDAKVEDDA